MELAVWQGDITTLDVDAVVNAANSGLRAGGGVCGAIFAAAGRDRLQRACDQVGGCATGDACLTPGFDLPARWVVHAVGPVWSGGTAGEDEALASAYRRSLEVAAEAGARTVAFPEISTGIYGFPAERAARIAVAALRDASASAPSVERVVLVAFGPDAEVRLRAAVGADREE